MLVAGCEVSNSRLDDARQWIDDQFFLFQEPGTAQISLDAHFPRARQAAFGGCVPTRGALFPSAPRCSVGGSG